MSFPRSHSRIARRLSLALLATLAVAAPVRAEDEGASTPPAGAERGDAPIAPSDDTTRRLDALERAVAEARASDAARIGALEHELAEARAPRSPEPEKRPFDVELTGFAQVDAVLYRQTSKDELSSATGEPLNDERVVVRRARPRILVRGGPFGAALMFEGTTAHGPAVRLLEAELSASWRNPRNTDVPYLAVGIGSFRTPFGFELGQMARHRFFLERTTAARALFGASFDLGLRVFGGVGAFRYSVAAMNGEPAGTTPFAHRDPNAAKDLMARLGVDTEVASRVRFAGGMSASTGKGLHRGSPATKDRISWRDDNENGVVEITEIRVLPGTPATPSMNFRRFVLGADARMSFEFDGVGPLLLEAEIYRATNMDRTLVPSDPVASGRDLRQLGFYLAASQRLGEHAMVGVRYDRYEPDADASEQRGLAVVPLRNLYSTWSFAAAAMLAPARLIAQYERRRNPLRRAPNGAPTTLADDTFTIRAEVAF